jgi:hypothetical protein
VLKRAKNEMTNSIIIFSQENGVHKGLSLQHQLRKIKAEKQQIQGLNNHALESDILGLNVISATY